MVYFHYRFTGEIHKLPIVTFIYLYYIVRGGIFAYSITCNAGVWLDMYHILARHTTLVSLYIANIIILSMLIVKVRYFNIFY